MQNSDWLGVLNILIAFLGVFIVGFTIFEWRKLRELREDMEGIEARTDRRIHAQLKSAHRILASYQIRDVAARIAILEEAVRECPQAFNGFNALGFAYLEKGDLPRAIDAFSSAVAHHPEDKAGYCDLAYAHHKARNVELTLKYLRKAVEVDASARDDILGDDRFAGIRGQM